MQVLVLEQHYTAGGLTHAFQRENKYAWSVGVHYIGQSLVVKRALISMTMLSESSREWKQITRLFRMSANATVSLAAHSLEFTTLHLLAGHKGLTSLYLSNASTHSMAVLEQSAGCAWGCTETVHC